MLGLCSLSEHLVHNEVSIQILQVFYFSSFHSMIIVGMKLSIMENIFRMRVLSETRGDSTGDVPHRRPFHYSGSQVDSSNIS